MEERVAVRVRKKSGATLGGLEQLLDTLANALFIVGLLIAGGQLLLLAIRPIMLLAALSSALTALSALISWAVFRFMAEVIRLLKKIAGLPYSGELTGGTYQDTYDACSLCGSRLYSQTRCDHCDARVVDGPDDSD